MRRILTVVAGAAILAGCGGRDDQQVAADSLARDIQLPAPDSTVALNDVPAAPVRTDTVFLPAPPPPPRRTTPRASAPAPAPAPAPVTPAPAPATAPARLESGATVEASAVSSITSKTNKPGETFTARIGEAVLAADGRTVIPAGSVVTLSIVALKPAPNKAAKD